MLTLPPAVCWLHPAVEVRDSPIEGRGLFAASPIARGETVSVLGGRVISDRALKAMLNRRAEDASLPFVDSITLGPEENLLLSPNALNRFGNHSCDPNTWWSDSVTLVARHATRANEEITNDYGTSTAHAEWAIECRCATALCRRVVSGEDWRRADLQQRYGDHWVPVILRMIRDARG